MVRIFEKLTSEVDIFNAPTLGVERGDFAYFFELQAMYQASLQSNEAHQEFIRLRREQNEEYRALKKTRKQEEDVLVKLIENNPALEGVHLNPKSVKEFQKNAKLLQRSINQQYSTKHELRREIGRLKLGNGFHQKTNAINRDALQIQPQEEIAVDSQKSTSMKFVKRLQAVTQSH